jgi:hypothetical protein
MPAFLGPVGAEGGVPDYSPLVDRADGSTNGRWGRGTSPGRELGRVECGEELVRDDPGISGLPRAYVHARNVVDLIDADGSYLQHPHIVVPLL